MRTFRVRCGALLACVFGIAVPTFRPVPAGAADPWLRVLVIESSPVVNLAGAAGAYAWDLATRRYVPTAGARPALNVRACCGGRLLLGGREQAGPLGVRTMDGSPLAVNGQAYRGYLELHGAGTRVMAVNVVPLEEYLYGVVRGEVPASWPLEALKAQAIVARTYALYQIRQNPGALWHLKATVESQVYKGLQGEDLRTTSAVDQTRGLVLARDGNFLPAFYHADSGGHTEDGAAVFPRMPNAGEVVGVEDPYSIGSPYFVWQQALPLDQIRRALAPAGYAAGPIAALEPAELTRSGRIQTLRIRGANGSFMLEGKRFRELMGYDVVRSTWFTAAVDGSVARLIGRGWGHGVGMPQWGAKGMADLAYRAPDILRFYFPVARIERLERLGCC